MVKVQDRRPETLLVLTGHPKARSSTGESRRGWRRPTRLQVGPPPFHLHPKSPHPLPGGRRWRGGGGNTPTGGSAPAPPVAPLPHPHPRGSNIRLPPLDPAFRGLSSPIRLTPSSPPTPLHLPSSPRTPEQQMMSQPNKWSTTTPTHTFNVRHTQAPVVVFSLRPQLALALAPLLASRQKQKHLRSQPHRAFVTLKKKNGRGGGKGGELLK